jgi:predicted membrane-bound spermidine synthase
MALHPLVSKYEKLVLIICFAVSGFTSLLYEIIWSKALNYVFGITIYAQATSIALFMAGLAFGSYLTAKLLSNSALVKNNALAVFALCQLAIGISGIYHQQLFHIHIGSQFLEILFYASIIFIPSLLIGACFPLVINSFADAKQINYVYAANTFGALIAIALSCLTIIPQFGLSGSSQLAASLNLLVSFIAFIFCQNRFCQNRNKFIEQSNTKIQTASSLSFLPFIYFLAFGQGFLSLLIELVWIRLFSLTFGSSIYSFCLVLFVFLLGTTIGICIVAKFFSTYKNSSKDALATLSIFAALTSISIILGLYFCNELPWIYFAATKIFAQSHHSLTFVQVLFIRTLPICLMILPTTIFMGTLLPLLFVHINSEANQIEITSTIYAVNTIGCLFGAIAACYLIPTLSNLFVSGIQTSIILVALSELVIAVSIIKLKKNDMANKIMVGSALLLLVFLPKNFNASLLSAGFAFTPDIFHYSREAIVNSLKKSMLYYKEGLNSTVTVNLNQKQNIIYLTNDGKVEAAVPTNEGSPTNQSDYPTQILLGLLPTIFYKSEVNNALLIGYGSGTTANALLQSPKLNKLQIIEIEPAVIDANKYFIEYNNNPISKDTVSLLINDARHILNDTRLQYDIIVSQPADPWVNGASALFTVEFWQLCQSRLTDNGIICQWIQLYSIEPEHLVTLLRTFQTVFPETFVFQPKNAGEIILLGFKNKQNFDNSQINVEKKLEHPSIKTLLARIDIQTKSDLISLLKLKPDQLKSLCQKMSPGKETPFLNTDDNLFLEFAQAKTVLKGKQTLDTNLAIIDSSANMYDNLKQ